MISEFSTIGCIDLAATDSAECLGVSVSLRVLGHYSEIGLSLSCSFSTKCFILHFTRRGLFVLSPNPRNLDEGKCPFKQLKTNVME